MSNHDLDFDTILHSAGYRVTTQRVLILNAVYAGKGHSTLKQIFARVQDMDKTIDRSSLYRTLKLFVKVGVVLPGTNADGEAVYEIPHRQPHHHLICQMCGHEQEIQADVIDTTRTLIQRQYGFYASIDHWTVFGICAECLTKQTAQASR